ncbi:DHA2 family efflux MFS transporter permease subunit [Actinocorallia longicatena]|uniref:MFS transporter n=1 Tax=Actinocorallia longicatena TaxID=111803 RepID=A0ABP6PX56_9ACTN
MRPWRTLSVVSLGTVLVVLNQTAMTVGLPVVVRHFDVGALGAGWIVLSFMLTQTALMVVFGRLADVFGRRGTYLAGFVVFTAASLAAGFAPDVPVLLAIRIVQGVAGAMILANGTAIVAHAFPAERLSHGLGVYLGVMTAAPLLGPSVGGYLASKHGWAWLFWFNVPLGVVAIVWGVVALPKVPPGEREPIDIAGAVLLAGWLVGLMLLLSEGGAGGWTTPTALWGSLGFVVLLPAFAARQLRARVPLVDLRLFADRSFTLANLAALTNVLGRMGSVFLVALYLQSVKGMTPAQAGIAVLPGPVASLVASPAGGWLGARFEPRRIAVGGAVLASAGLLVLVFALTPDAPYSWTVAGLVLSSIGSAVFYAANTTSVLSTVPADRLGVVNGLRLTLHFIGISLSTALSLTLVTSALPAADRGALYASGVTGPLLGSLFEGYHRAFLALFAVSALSVVVSLLSSSRHRKDALAVKSGPSAGRDPARTSA